METILKGWDNVSNTMLKSSSAATRARSIVSTFDGVTIFPVSGTVESAMLKRDKFKNFFDIIHVSQNATHEHW